MRRATSLRLAPRGCAHRVAADLTRRKRNFDPCRNSGLTKRQLNPTFARFVYCLGYGEHEFAGPSLPRTTGTPQFWKLFASCVHPPSKDAFAPLLKCGNPSFLSRLRAELALLEELRALGVWLVDASAVALYRPGGARPAHPVCQTVLKRSWHAYTGALVREAKPHSIVVIGKGVARALDKELSAVHNVEVHCVSQPQGCRRAGDLEEVFATLHQVCQHAARARGVR